MNFCRNIWSRHSHTLESLTNLTLSNLKFKWKGVKQKFFDGFKRIVILNTLLDYPDFNNQFEIHTNNSDFQLGLVIIQ